MNIITSQMVTPKWNLLMVAGEDTLYRCTSCSYARNAELHDKKAGLTCPNCEQNTLYTSTSIELGHTFFLGTKYSSIFDANYTPAHDPSAILNVQMGCYGLGLSRMIGAIVEMSHDDSGIIWPESVAPWNCVVIQGKLGGEDVYDGIASILGADNVLLDDRSHVGLGWKVHDARKIGYPHIVVLGHSWQDNGMIEVIHRRTGEKKLVESSALSDPKFWKI
jgi:prolyl-tRNA synthetase